MNNPYATKTIKIIRISQLTDNIKLFRFKFEKSRAPKIQPGQFVELAISGWGEAPFAPCQPLDADYLELCVRAAGRLTNHLHEMDVGDKLGFRGPYGNGWPAPDNGHPSSILAIVGGLGLAPLRSLILGKNKLLDKNAKIQIFYGAKKPDEMLFRHEYGRWQKNNIQVNLTIDKECANWRGCVGLVTTLFDKIPINNHSTVYLCGPPAMYRPVLEKLLQKGFNESDIFLSLERRMHCGVGICQHCAVGPYYTCKHGPVFNWCQLKNIPDAI